MSDRFNIVQGNASIAISSDLGYITGGVQMVVASEMYFSNPEGVPANLHARNVKQTYELKTTLLEPTQANMKIAFDWQNSSATASGGGNRLEFGGENYKPSENTVSIYGYVPGSSLFTRTIYGDRAIAIPGSEYNTSDAEETKLPLTLHLLYDTTNTRNGYVDDATS